MFYEILAKGYVRVPPHLFGKEVKDAVLNQLHMDYDGYVSKDIGMAVGVSDVLDIGEGIIIPGDGAAHYETRFKLLVFRPELQEVVTGKITEITDFGAFIELGPIDGMIHISQTMDDYVSFSKSNVLTGKESKRTLKPGDLCRARIIAISYKDITNPRIGLTMRQPWLGSIKYMEEEAKKSKK